MCIDVKGDFVKRSIFVLVLVAVLATGTAFADYPNNLGIGVKGGFSGPWGEGDGVFNAALSLKVPNLPIFWGVYLGVPNKELNIAISGDYYIFHNQLVPNINLHWYISVGGEFGLKFGDDNFKLGAGVRFPFGLSWQIEFTSFPTLEFFLQAVPRLGAYLTPFEFPYGGWGGDIGIRIWLDI